MPKWRFIAFLLVLAIANSLAKETVEPSPSKYRTLPEEVLKPAKTSKTLDYESALRPATLKKRSIGHIARLLLGGGPPPPNHPFIQPSPFAEPRTWNMASNIAAAIFGDANQQSWQATQSNPQFAENIQQILAAKAGLNPGYSGLASMGTQAIAQAAVEAAAKSLATVAAAHMVKNTPVSSINQYPAPQNQVEIKDAWQAYQQARAQPRLPYHQASAYINHYQAPPPSFQMPFQIPTTTPAPAPPKPQIPAYLKEYYNFYQSQQQQQAYTPAPPLSHHHRPRPTLSPKTLIATTPAPILGRNAVQPSFTSSLLSIINTLFSAYNAPDHYHQASSQPGEQQQQPSAFFQLYYPPPPGAVRSQATNPASSILTSGINSAAQLSNGYQNQQPISSNYASAPSYVQHLAESQYPAVAAESVAVPSYTLNQPVSSAYNYPQTQQIPYNTPVATPASIPQYSSVPVAPLAQYTPSAPAAYSPPSTGAGYPGYGAGSTPAWNTAPTSAPSPSWPVYSSQTQAISNNYPQNYVASASAPAQYPAIVAPPAQQQSYPATSAPAYQTPVANNYNAPVQQPQFKYTYSVKPYQPTSKLASTSSRNTQASGSYDDYEVQDTRQYASSPGNDYDYYNEENIEEIRPVQSKRKNKPVQPSNVRYPSPAKKRPAKRPVSKTQKKVPSYAKVQNQNVFGDHSYPSEESVEIHQAEVSSKWKNKNLSGQQQRPMSLYNLYSNQDWNEKPVKSKHTFTKTVSGNTRISPKHRTQPSQPKHTSPIKNYSGNKKIAQNNEMKMRNPHQNEKKKYSQSDYKPKTQAAQLYRGQMKHEQKSKHSYSTLPEYYVMKVGDQEDDESITNINSPNFAEVINGETSEEEDWRDAEVAASNMGLPASEEDQEQEEREALFTEQVYQSQSYPQRRQDYYEETESSDDMDYGEKKKRNAPKISIDTKVVLDKKL